MCNPPGRIAIKIRLTLSGPFAEVDNVEYTTICNFCQKFEIVRKKLKVPTIKQISKRQPCILVLHKMAEMRF